MGVAPALSEVLRVSFENHRRVLGVALPPFMADAAAGGTSDSD